MANNTVISSSINPDLANRLAVEAMSAPSEVAAVEERPFTAAPSGHVDLLAGIYNPITGMHITTAEVRELNGADEEALAKSPDTMRGMLLLLQRATVSLGEEPATPELLDKLLAGDRDLLLLAIRKVTFGTEVEMFGPCLSCGTTQDFVIDLDKDIPIKNLADPISDRRFSVKCKVGNVHVSLPSGVVQKKLLLNADKTGAELDTLLLIECVESINDVPILNPRQLLEMGMADRRKILKEISDRSPGPQFFDIKKQCPSCESEVTLPLSLADLFLG